MSNFTYWYEEFADMPFKQNGVWVDLETGFTYADYIESLKHENKIKRRFKPNDRIKSARDIAKQFGGKALKGSAKQKAWGETLRANVLKSANEIQGEILCYLKIFQHAAFWIDNRNMQANEICLNAERYAELLKKVNKLLHEAEAKLVVDSQNIIIDYTEYNKVMEIRKPLLNELDSLFIIKE
jgi:hypothetical protein